LYDVELLNRKVGICPMVGWMKIWLVMILSLSGSRIGFRATKMSGIDAERLETVRIERRRPSRWRVAEPGRGPGDADDPGRQVQRNLSIAQPPLDGSAVGMHATLNDHPRHAGTDNT
jgi:hypothetical protein